MERVKASATELVRRNLALEAVLAEAGLDGAVTSAILYSDVVALVRAHAEALHQPAAMLATQHITRLLLGALGPEEMKAALLLASDLHASLLLSTSHLLSLLTKDVDRLSLGLLWGLHCEHLLPLEDLLSPSTAVTDHLVGCLARSTDEEKAAAQGVASVLIEQGFSSVKQGEHSSQLARDILFRTIRATFTADRFSQPPPYTLCDIVMSCPSISRAAIRAFFSHLATHLSLSSPHDSVFATMAQQQQWKFTSLPPHTVALYSAIADNMDGSEAVKVIQQLSDKELNWQSLMSFIACLLNTTPGVASALQGAISSLVSSAVVECHAPSLYSGLVLARQCSFEGTHVFPSYQKWVQQMFGDSRTTVITSKRALQFLLKCLTEAVPHEPAFSLRAHIASPPRHIAKGHTLIPDYISLAKTRLHDLKEPFPESSGIEGQTEWSEAKADVQQALEHFQRSGKVHPSILQASIFKKPYFVGRFLPTLLTPTIQPGGGIRDNFIQALVREKKVPQRLLTGYKKACNQARLGGPLPAMDHRENAQDSAVTTILHQLLGVIQRKEGVTRLLSKLSSALERHVHCRWHGGDEEVAVDLRSPGREQWEVELVDTLVSTVCECVLLCSNLAVDRSALLTTMESSLAGYYWLPPLLDMLSGHPALHPALYVRLWELLHAQETQLSDSHLLGLAVLCSEMFGSVAVFSPLKVEGAQTFKSCSEYCRGVLGGLEHCTARSMHATLRFGCHFVHHSLTQRNLVKPEDEELQIAPPILIQKMWFLYNRYCFSQQHPEIPQTEKPSSEGTMNIKLPDFPAVVELVGATDGLLQVPEFKHLWNNTQLPFQDWAAWELAVEDDVMPRHSRLEYLRTTLYCHYLTLPVGGRGLGGSRREAFCLLFGSMAQCGGGGSWSEGSMAQCGGGGSWSEGLQLLQEVAHCLLEDRRGGENLEMPCLVQAMTDLTADLGGSTGVPGLSHLHNQRTLSQESFKIAYSLPPQLFFCDSPAGDPPNARALEASAVFLQHHMEPLAASHLLLPTSLTQYLLQGLIMLDRNGGDNQEQFLQFSPLYHASLIFHWPQLHCHNLSDQLHSRLEAASHWVHSSFEAALPTVVGIDPIIIGVCAFGEIMKNQSRSTEQLLDRIASSLGEASNQVVVVICHCCVSELTASTLHGDCTADQRLLDLAKACLTSEPSAVESLDEGVDCCITHKQLLLRARTHLTTRAVTHLLPIVLFRVLSCLRPSSLPQLVQQQHPLLPLCLKAHATCLQLNCTITTPAQMCYQPFSILFIRECTQLTRQVIHLAPLARLKCVEGLCHVSIRPALLSRIS